MLLPRIETNAARILDNTTLKRKLPLEADMTTATFDTLGYFERLRAAGVPEEQAKVQADAIREVIDNKISSLENRLVSKTDLQIAMAELKHDLLKWIVGLAFAQAALTVTLFSIG
jgi:hypothetical protein